MPKRPKPRPLGGATTEISAPEGWFAQRSLNVGSGPDYKCPRCERTVPRRTEHIVAWTTDEPDAQHRHWHKACWEAAVREGIDRYRFV